MEYKRDDAVTALASLREGHAFLKALPANAATAPAAASASTPVTEHARLRAAARAGSAAAAAILLRRHPDLARCPQVWLDPHPHGLAEQGCTQKASTQSACSLPGEARQRREQNACTRPRMARQR